MWVISRDTSAKVVKTINKNHSSHIKTATEGREGEHDAIEWREVNNAHKTKVYFYCKFNSMDETLSVSASNLKGVVTHCTSWTVWY